MTERTFIMIKPDRENIAITILNTLNGLLQDYGDLTRIIRVNSIPKEVIKNHYILHKDKDFYQRMIDYFTDKSVVLAVYEGKEGLINKCKEVVGNTDPAKATEGTIRYIFSRDSLEKAIAEERPVENVIHCSDSVKEAKREIDVWKEYLEDTTKII